MANLYVRSTDGSDSDNGTTWALAKATVQGALAIAAAGDVIYVSQVHAQTTASTIDLDSPGTAANPVKIVCVNDGAAPPTAVATTGTITTTGGNVNLRAGYAYWYGLSFVGLSSIHVGEGATHGGHVLDTCVLSVTLSSAGADIRIGPAGVSTTNTYTTLKNCTFKFGHTGAYVAVFNGRKSIIGGGISGAGSAPTVFFQSFSAWYGQLVVNGFDFSAMGSNTLIAAFDASGGTPDLLLTNCKLGASAVISATQTIPHRITLLNSDSSGTNYRTEQRTLLGTQTTETTIVRTGGASDGVTPIAWKIVTGANASWTLPFECAIPLSIKNNTVSSNVTVTVYGIAASIPNNDELWIEVHYMGASGSPIHTINTANTKASFVTTAAAQTTDGTSVWGGSTAAFKMAVTLSSPQPALKGPIYVIVKAAKVSSTFYVDPKIVLS